MRQGDVLRVALAKQSHVEAWTLFDSLDADRDHLAPRLQERCQRCLVPDRLWLVATGQGELRRVFDAARSEYDSLWRAAVAFFLPPSKVGSFLTLHGVAGSEIWAETAETNRQAQPQLLRRCMQLHGPARSVDLFALKSQPLGFV